MRIKNMLIVLIFCIIFAINISAELVQVHVLFRHGARSPVETPTFPTDPYAYLSQKPYGTGDLTIEGKRQAYKLGKILRRRYNTILGEVYSGRRIETLSTQIDRVVSTALVVFAGMWPPKVPFIEKLNWQPIPLKTVEIDNPILRLPRICPSRDAVVQKISSDSAFTSLLEPYTSTIEYIRKNTGYDYINCSNLYQIHQQLESEYYLGLEMPEWTKNVFPNKTSFLAGFYYIANTFTDELNRSAGGALLRKIIEDMKKIINNNDSSKAVNFYSAHEYNIAYLLTAMNTFSPQMPPYASYLAIELHNITSGQYYVKVLFENYTKTEPYLLKVPGCNKLCPLKDFEDILFKNLDYSDGSCPDL